MNKDNLLSHYGCYTFNDDVMKERLPKETYLEFRKSLESTTVLIRTMMFEDGIIADDLAGASEVIQELNRQFVNEDYNIMDIE